MKERGMDLNLLPDQAKFQMTRMRVWRRVVLFCKVFLIVWILLAGSVFGIHFFFKADYESKNKKYKELVNSYQTLADKVVLAWRLKSRVRVVKNILDKRFEYGKAFTAVNSLIPSGIVIEDMELVGEDGFVIKVKTEKSEMIDWLEGEVEAINKKQVKNFKDAKIKSLNVDKKGWSFTMEVAYNEQT